DAVKNFFFDDVSTVIHLAGYAHDVKSEVNKEDYFNINVKATKNLVEVAKASGVSHFIYLSSTKAGPNDDFQSSEQKAEGVYGESKRVAELTILNLAIGSNMRVNIIRPALIYGPNVKGNLKLMISGIKQGWFPPLPFNNNKRSMVHVDDVARCIAHLDDRVKSDRQIYQLTDNQEYSSYEIYDILCEVLGKKIRKLRLPLFLFTFLSKLHPSIKFKLNKLLGSETFSCSKILSTGYEPKKTLRNIHETNY
ncbi:NAD-dependent epimerase/dehydratase family protein, partial [Gammaproteobacteria bacterium]|nr:NAD-dependent epimerase/dehydratase family protein [Gammaproteobacteria bacterium]